MNMLEFKIRKIYRHFKYWLIRKMCTEAEWRTLRVVRAGYYGNIAKANQITAYTSSFEINDASHEFLREDDGCKYDARYGLARQLLKEHEEELIKHTSYTEAWDEKKQMWICTAELNLVEVIKE